VLLLCSASSRPRKSVLTSEDGLITVKFLPPNVTSIIQPVDQGVIASVKQRYQIDLRTVANEGDNIIALWKKMMGVGCYI
jgi:hypothetical protein